MLGIFLEKVLFYQPVLQAPQGYESSLTLALPKQQLHLLPSMGVTRTFNEVTVRAGTMYTWFRREQKKDEY